MSQSMDKTNKMTYAPSDDSDQPESDSEDSDQPEHVPSPISIRCLHEETMEPKLPTDTECTAKIDQAVRMRRLILVLAGRIGHWLVLLCCGSKFLVLKLTSKTPSWIL